MILTDQLQSGVGSCVLVVRRQPSVNAGQFHRVGPQGDAFESAAPHAAAVSSASTVRRFKVSDFSADFFMAACWHRLADAVKAKMAASTQASADRAMGTTDPKSRGTAIA